MTWRKSCYFGWKERKKQLLRKNPLWVSLWAKLPDWGRKMKRMKQNWLHWGNQFKARKEKHHQKHCISSPSILTYPNSKTNLFQNLIAKEQVKTAQAASTKARARANPKSHKSVISTWNATKATLHSKKERTCATGTTTTFQAMTTTTDLFPLNVLYIIYYPQIIINPCSQRSRIS